MVTVGFIDPGNWASNIAAGSEFGYILLWMVTLSTIMLIILQHNAAHLGIATGLCLSEATTKYTHPAIKWLVSRNRYAGCHGHGYGGEILVVRLHLRCSFTCLSRLAPDRPRGCPLPCRCLILTIRLKRSLSVLSLSLVFHLSSKSFLLLVSWGQALTSWVTPHFQRILCQ